MTGAEAVRLSTWQRVAVGLAVALLLVTAMTGPYLALEQAHEANQQLHEVRRSDADVQRILDFIASVSTGPQAKASREATAWYVAEFQAICRAEPGCRPAPLPDSLKQQLRLAQQPPPTIPGTPATTVPSARQP